MQKICDLLCNAQRRWKKTFRIMKLTTGLLLFAMVTATAAKSYSQKARLNLNLKDATIVDIFREIEKTSEFGFFFKSEELNNEKRQSVMVSDATIDEVLKKVLDTNYSYKILDKNIVVTKGNLEATQQQGKNVTGKVTDSTGGSLPGVSVVVKGTTTGVITDLDGKYSLSNIPENAVLQFSFVGMKTQEIAVGNKTTINVTLAEETIGIEEVVAIGFGTQKKVNLTGAVSTIKTEALESVPVSNTVQALQGMVPGLNITQSSTLGGQLNNNPSINIRGTGTIGTGSNGNALVLIDGMEGDLNSVNSDDIENISILKDASSSAIYGSRAPFGVILVTTKKGKTGKCQVNFNSDFRSSSPILLPHMADSYQYTTAINDACFNAGQTAYFNNVRIQRIKDYMEGKISTVGIEDPSRPGYWREMYYEGNSNYDIYDKVYKKSAPSQEYSLNISGGNDNITYYVSGNYINQDGLLKLGSDAKNVYGPEAGKDWIKKYNLNANIDFKISKWASLSYVGKFYSQDYQRPTDMGGLNQNLARQG